MLRSLVLAWSVLLCGGCLLDPPERDFYGRVVVPQTREFRWSNGGVPKIFDPALAAAAPDTDAVRALFEGLTDFDPRTLEPIPAVAEKWQSSQDNREWTFQLRRGARWNNGDPVTAQDFVRSWQRVIKLGERATHAKLLKIIEGTSEGSERDKQSVKQSGTAEPTNQESPNNQTETQNRSLQSPNNSTVTPNVSPGNENTSPAPPAAPPFGAVAVNDFTLRVRLVRPDTNFPSLVAHTIFHPVHRSVTDEADAKGLSGSGEDTATNLLQNRALPSAPTAMNRSPVIGNGAFELNVLNSATDEVVLNASKNYWNAAAVKLERVRFVGARDAESALSAYRAGEIDAVTNANLQPLAVKLLTPYKDFRRTTFGALTYYAFNRSRRPFTDQRVRRALTLALDRSRLTADDMSGATVPATKFVPPSSLTTNGQTATERTPVTQTNKDESGTAASNVSGAKTVEVASPDEKNSVEAKQGNDAESRNTAVEQSGAKPVSTRAKNTTTAAVELSTDANEARRLLAEAGYPAGANFPVVHLLVNRNEQQRRIATSVAQMWQSTLGIKTEVIVKDWQDYEAAVATGDFDIARRSMVMQTMDETTNMLQIFDYEASIKNEIDKETARVREEAKNNVATQTTAQRAASPQPAQNGDADRGSATATTSSEFESPRTEAEALRESAAIPVYFATSFALVKPYVDGFDANLFDAPSLQRVRIDATWKQQQPARKDATWTNSSP